MKNLRFIGVGGWFTQSVGVLVCVALMELIAAADTTVTQPNPANVRDNASAAGANVSLSPAVINRVGTLAQNHLAAMQAAYPDYKFVYGGSLNGNWLINSYQARADNAGGGASMDLRYVRAKTDPSLASLRFVQVIDTSAPINGGKSPGVDSSSGIVPFYYFDDSTEDENKDPGDGNGMGSYYFDDEPQRPYPAPPVPPAPFSSLGWGAILYIASYNDATKTVTIYDGVSWGFHIQRF